MNRIFRKVWNASMGQWVVASELASGDRPGQATRDERRAVKSLGSAALLALAMTGGPLAAQDFTVTDGATPAAIGPGGVVTFSGGSNIDVVQTGGADAAVVEIALDPDLTVDSLTAGTTRIDGTGVAIGTDVVLGATGLSLGAGAPSIGTTGIHAGGLVVAGVANATAADHAVNLGQLQQVQEQAAAGWNVAVGAGTHNIGPGGTVAFAGDSNVSVTLGGAEDAASVQLALNPNLTATSLTTGATTVSTTGVAVGTATFNATGLRLGPGAPSVTTGGIDAGGLRITNVAPGQLSATSTDAVTGQQIFDLFIEAGAGGVRYFHAASTRPDSRALGAESIAIGPETIAAGDSSLAAGDAASTTAGATGSIALGQAARVGTADADIPDGDGAIAIGRNAAAAGNRTLALGDGAAVGSEFAQDALAIGTGAQVAGAFSSRATAIGAGAQAGALGATAIGAQAIAGGEDSVALGRATAGAVDAIAAGRGAQAATQRGIALGTDAGVGTAGTDAGDRTDHVAIGTRAGRNVVGNLTTAIGYDAGTGVEGDDNLALGTEAGRGLQGNNNISIGRRANDGAGARAQAVAIGDNTAAGTNSVALGSGAQAAGSESLALGKDATAGGNGVAVGAHAVAEGSNIALGRNSIARDADVSGAGYLTGSAAPGSAVSVGNSVAGGSFQRRIVNVADGAQGYDAVNVRQLRGAQQAVANLVGGGVAVNPDGSYGPITVKDSAGNDVTFNSVVEALGAVTDGTVEILPADAVRYNADGTVTVAAGVLGNQAVNVDQLNQAIDENGNKYFSANTTEIANRGNDGATGENAMAIGPAAVAGGDSSLSVGHEAVVDAGAHRGVAIGYDVNAKAINSTVLGNSGAAAYDQGGVAVGQAAVSRGLNSIVIGTGAESDPQTAASVDNAIVIGTIAEASADNGIAIGHDALASDVNAVAQGYDAHAIAANAQASGTRARSSGVNAQASGTDAWASGSNAVANGTNSRGLAADGIALGTGAVSGFAPAPGQEALNVNAIAIGTGANAVYQNATAIGRAALADQVAAAAVGDGASATAEAALALGRSAAASGTSSIAQGDGATASAEAAQASGRGAGATAASALAHGDGALASAASASAVGRLAQATGTSASAFGHAAQATFANTVAVGAQSRATAVGAAAFGQNAAATAANAVALGVGATAGHARSVALGQGAATAAAVGTASVVVDKTTYAFAGASPVGTVSVGTAQDKRTLTNVAAGRISATSTDAINGSQLYGTNLALNALAGDLDTAGASIADVLGGNAAYDPDTHTVTMTNIGGTGENTVHDAIGYAAQGWNVSAQGGAAGVVAPGATVDFANDDGNIVVARDGTDLTFDLADDITVASVTAGDTVLDTDGVTIEDGAGNVANLTAGGLAATDGSATVNIAPGTVAVGDGTYTSTLAPTALTVGGAFPVVVDGATGTIGGLQNRTFDPDNFTSGQAATEDQLAVVSGLVNAGWNVTDADGNQAKIGPNGVVTFQGDANIGVAQTGVDQSGVVAITLNRDLDVDSVTAGDAVLDTDGLAVDDGAGNATTVGAGAIAVRDAGGTTTIGGNAISVGGANPIAISGDTGTIGGLQNQTIDYPDFADGSGRAATEEQLDLVNQAANAGWNLADAEGHQVNIGPDGLVTFEGDANIGVAQTGADQNGVVAITLNRDLDVDSVTAGDTVIDGTGVAIGPDVRLGDAGLTIVGGPSVTLAGIDAGNTIITNVAAGVDDTDAVNVGQLRDTVAASRTRYYSVNSTGGGNEDNDGASGEDAIAAGKDATAAGEQAVALGLGSSADGTGALALGAQAQALSLNSLAIGAGAVSSHANSIALGAGSATTVGAQSGYQGAYVGSSDSSGELNIGGRQLTGVAAGSAATDGVNVSQLQAGVTHAISEANSYTDTQIGGVNNRIDQLDGRVTQIEGDIVDIRGDITDIQGDIVDIRGDITDLGDRVTDIEGVVVEVDNRITNLENGASGPFRISQDEPYVAPAPTGTNAAAGGNGAVASGADSVAVGNQSVASGAGSTALGQGATASAADSTALGHGATASHGNSVALGAGSATTVGAQASYNAAYVGNSSSTGEVNVGGRTVTGVAPGIAGTDAVNVNQLNAGVNHAIGAANAYTDGRINQIEGDLWTIDRGYRGATASAMAMAGLPQAYLPGKSMLAVGFGGYQSEYGMAIGLSGITDNGRYVYRAQASGNTARDWGFSVGAGIQW
ncbi:YadA-like family protein [Luteimonas huabeiensis]|uniref:YadA-like family protein n=1 Tax=Luteimonas huabeiensis TaxID=1244513 RepID=UPI0004B60BC4|nr:YadA-like family protein [Luteimonas huabeiensis]